MIELDLSESQKYSQAERAAHQKGGPINVPSPESGTVAPNEPPQTINAAVSDRIVIPIIAEDPSPKLVENTSGRP